MAQTHHIDTGLDEEQLLAELVEMISAARRGQPVDVSQGEITVRMYAEKQGVSTKSARHIIKHLVKRGLMERLTDKKLCRITQRKAITYRWVGEQEDTRTDTSPAE